MKICETNLNLKSNEASTNLRQVQELQKQKTLDDQQMKLHKENIVKMENELLKLKSQKLQNENSENVEKLKVDFKVQEVLLSKAKDEIVECKSEKTELKLLVQAEKNQCSKQMDFIRELNQKLESQYNATCIAETKELRNNLQLKLDENDELIARLEKQDSEMNEKNENIEALERKLQNFGRL